MIGGLGQQPVNRAPMTAPERLLRGRMVGLATLGLNPSAAAAASGAAAQSQAKVYRVGYLRGLAPTLALRRYGMHSSTACASTATLRGNLVLHLRYSAGQDARNAELAAELVRLNVDVIVSSTTNGALAAKQVTSTIPIVTILAGDAVGSGLVASLARPGGNVTGLTSQATDLTAKQLQLLREVAPGSAVGVPGSDADAHQPGFPRDSDGAAILHWRSIR